MWSINCSRIDPPAIMLLRHIPSTLPARPRIQPARINVHRRRATLISCNVSKTELSSSRLYRPNGSLLRGVEPFSLLSKAALEAMVRMLSCKIIPKGMGFQPLLLLFAATVSPPGSTLATEGIEPAEAAILVSGVFVAQDGTTCVCDTCIWL